MPQYEWELPTRAEWQKVRDAAKVPKGLAKPSIGDDLDTLHSTFAVGTMTKHKKAAEKLTADLDVYLKAATKSYPAFATTITTYKKRAQRHEKFVADVVRAEGLHATAYAEALRAYNSVREGGGRVPLKTLAAALEKLLGPLSAFAVVDQKHWGAKRQNINQLFGLCERESSLNPKLDEAIGKALAAVKP